MKFNATWIKNSISEGNSEITLTTPLIKDLAEFNKCKEIISKGKFLSVEIKEFRNKRSHSANDYCWVLCQKIAEVIGNTKEFVYKETIKHVGQFEIVPIKNEAVERWIEVWGSKGLGWFAEVLDDSKLEGYKKVISYYGSSCYNSAEQYILINEIVSQCKELDIETKSENEIKSLIENME